MTGSVARGTRNVAPRGNKTRERLLVGLMSGTSLDGVDAALVSVLGEPRKPKPRLLAFITVPYPKKLRARLLAVAGGKPVPSGEISELNFLVGECFAKAALEVCDTGKVRPGRLAGIGSHGQTIFHCGPGRGSLSRGRDSGAVASTLQIGESAVIAERTGAPVVSDFRTADIAAGGQGAPLVPLVDYLLLGDAKRSTVALNIGGIANLTVIPAGAGPRDVTGFDTGPGNMLIDGLVRHFTQGRQHYDRGGRGAAHGQVVRPLLNTLLHLPFFDRKPPKSAGREEFGQDFLDRYFLRSGKDPEDLLSTATELTVQTIAGALHSFVFPRVRADRLVISGGGSHNSFLAHRLAETLSPMEIRLSGEFGLPVDAKEAIAFAILADRTLRGLAGNLPSVTGARREVVLGKTARPGKATAGN